LARAPSQRSPLQRLLARLGVGLALACASLGALAGARSARAPLESGEPRAPDLDDELQRVLLEQELVLSERTARMLAELDQRLAEWHAGRGGGGS
jgi:hypothetical protein